MASPRIAVDFYYDIASSWSYFAFVILKRYESIWNLDINMKPNLLGGVFKASGNQAPINVKNKGYYMGNYDLVRTADYYGMKVVGNQPGFPPNTKDVMKFLRVIQDKRPDLLSEVTQRFWEVGWGKGQIMEVVKPENFVTVLQGIVDESSIEHWLKQSDEPPYKSILRTEAEKLVAEGCFGNPWIIVTNPATGKSEPFWGSDRFEVMAHWLGKTWQGPHPVGTKAKI